MRLNLHKETGDEVFYVETFDCEVDGKASVELHANFLNDDGCARKKR